MGAKVAFFRRSMADSGRGASERGSTLTLTFRPSGSLPIRLFPCAWIPWWLGPDLDSVVHMLVDSGFY